MGGGLSRTQGSETHPSAQKAGARRCLLAYRLVGVNH